MIDVDSGTNLSYVLSSDGKWLSLGAVRQEGSEQSRKKETQIKELNESTARMVDGWFVQIFKGKSLKGGA